MEEWKNTHSIRKHSEVGVLPPLGPGNMPLSKVTLCRRVGFCMCSTVMKSRALFREALVRQLDKAFVKGSAGRKVYEGCIAVMRLYSPTLTAQQTFWFIGMGNLSDLDFTVQRLHEFDELEHVFVPPPLERRYSKSLMTDRLISRWWDQISCLLLATLMRLRF